MREPRDLLARTAGDSTSEPRDLAARRAGDASESPELTARGFGGDPDGLDRLSRRALFRLAGAGAAAAGLAACSSRPARDILPYASQPPEVTPGVALHYATALVEDGFVTGVVVAAREGRPIKLDGNPDHPASLGASRARDQAAVLSLYDPQRARAITERGMPATASAIAALLARAAERAGRGLHLVLPPTTSPIEIALIERVRRALPRARFAFWSPFALDASLAGNRLALGRPLQTQLDLRAADVVVTLDADLVSDHPMALAHARQLADRRRVVDGGSTMSRLYAIETGYSPMGILADHRLAVRPSDVARIAAALLGELAAQPGAAVPAELTAAIGGAGAPGDHARWVSVIAADLRRAAGRSVVAAGEHQPPIVHAIAAAINAALGSAGRTVRYTEPVALEAGQPSHGAAGLGDLVRAIGRGEVATALVLGVNAAYTAPADLELAAALARVPASLYLGLYEDETARACRFFAPALHDLERWGAARAHDGHLTPIQPLIEPLFGGRSTADLLHALLGDPPAGARDRVRAAWAELPGDFEAALALGVVPGTAAPPVETRVAWDALGPAIAAALHDAPATTGPAGAALELAIRPHPYVHDGRHTNNPWLLELPEPSTQLTWDSAAQMSPRTAARLGVGDGDLVTLTVDPHRRAVEVPAIIVPGHADGAITLHAGFGRDGGERIARGIGASAFRLWTTAMGRSPPVTAVAHGGHRALATTQVHHRLEGCGALRSAALEALRDDAALASELASQRADQPSLYAALPVTGAQWAMSIDLTTCTGCSACVMACAAENNTPVVGKRRVLDKREMHWLRIDRYVLDEPAPGEPAAAPQPTAAVQPMTCQHCEQAPCEYVCPVEATTHSPDGLNEMTYNRCIGTRFCSNNCPYKVRRFNWFDFKEHGGLRVLGRNPDVTVRDRGVMEKCTYCVQRIRRAEIDARVAGRPLAGDDVQTACQQACPTRAIAFGSIGDPASAVSEHRRRPHSYAVLHDQGTRPRTRYLARIRNTNPALNGHGPPDTRGAPK